MPRHAILTAAASPRSHLDISLSDRDPTRSTPDDQASAALTELVYRACESTGGLETFLTHAWPLIEPETPLVSNWHIGAICEHLEAVTYGQIRNLVINIPPRFAKSSLVTVAWGPWHWGPAGRPGTQFLYSSYAQILSTRDARKRRRIIGTPWYRHGWGHRFMPTGRGRNLADGQIKYENDRGGYFLATSVDGSNTGEGGHILVCDDAHNLQEIRSDVLRQKPLTWWDGVMASRLNDPKTGAKIIIMQRGHEHDLSGHVLAQGGYVHLCLPCEFEPDRRCRVFLHGLDGDHAQPGPGDDLAAPFFEDPRTQAGELLFPARLGPDEIARLKTTLGAFNWSAQYQQSPTPAGGGILLSRWWRFWVPPHHHYLRQRDTETSALIAGWRRDPDTGEQGPGHDLLPYPAHADQRIQSWDCAFKEVEDGSYVVGQHWARVRSVAYLGAQVRDRLSFTRTHDAILDFSKACRAHPLLGQAHGVYIEDKANGPAIVDALRHSIPGIQGYTAKLGRSEGSKEARVAAISPMVEAGQVVLPHPSIAPWVEELVRECAMFPNVTHDDQVDALSQALLILLFGKTFGPANFGRSQ